MASPDPRMNACKLTPSQARVVMQSTRPAFYWAAEFEVDRSTITSIRQRKTYRAVTKDLPDWPGVSEEYYHTTYQRRSGPSHPQAKLTAVQVRVIRATAEQVPASVFAEGLGVDKTTIRNVRRGRSYRDVS